MYELFIFLELIKKDDQIDHFDTKILKTFAKIDKKAESSFENSSESLRISKKVDLLGGLTFFKVF